MTHKFIGLSYMGQVIGEQQKAVQAVHGREAGRGIECQRSAHLAIKVAHMLTEFGETPYG